MFTLYRTVTLTELKRLWSSIYHRWDLTVKVSDRGYEEWNNHSFDSGKIINSGQKSSSKELCLNEDIKFSSIDGALKSPMIKYFSKQRCKRLHSLKNISSLKKSSLLKEYGLDICIELTQTEIARLSAALVSWPCLRCWPNYEILS